MDVGKINLESENLPDEPFRKTLSPDPLPQGAAPRILLEHVRNTAPFIFGWQGDIPPYIATLQRVAKQVQTFPSFSLDHPDYFEFAVSAHWTTVGSFVPTDVDNQIRFKLWHPTLSLDVLGAMVDTVRRARYWPVAPVSTRWVKKGEAILSGHAGEWFTIAAGAYGGSRKKHPPTAAKILEEIIEELENEAEIFASFVKARDGVNALKACALIAHNLGDLIRVADMWSLEVDEPLRLAIEKRLNKGCSLMVASELYKKLMALENHRHFSLRKPRVLRRESDFLLPIGPFFDEWGASLAKHPTISQEELAEVAEALIDGWAFLKGPVGYARALAGMEQHFPGGPSALYRCLPSRIEKTLRTGPLRSLVAISRERFENQWAQAALKFLG